MTNKRQMDDGKVFSGFVLGLVGGGLVALFRGPRVNFLRRTEDGKLQAEEAVRESIQAIMPKDPLKESIEEAKENARRYRRDATARR